MDNNEKLVLVLLGMGAVCLAVILMNGCSFIQDDGQDRHLLRAEISILGGSTNSRLVTSQTEKILEESAKPTIREAEVHREEARNKTEVKKEIINHGLVERVDNILD